VNAGTRGKLAVKGTVAYALLHTVRARLTGRPLVELWGELNSAPIKRSEFTSQHRETGKKHPAVGTRK
jgi:hypothetical protein